jgi:hypothetical protein
MTGFAGGKDRYWVYFGAAVRDFLTGNADVRWTTNLFTTGKSGLGASVAEIR